jgi:hypothetical protein
MENANDASKAAGSVLKAVSIGEITPIEGSRVMGTHRQLQAHFGAHSN